MNDDGGRIFLVSELARRLQCSAETIRALADKNLLPARRTAKGTRVFEQRDVEIFEARRASLQQRR